MDPLMELFDPNFQDIGIWTARVLIFILITYLPVWLAALFLCRIRWFITDNLLLRIYFAWLIPLAFHAIFFAFFVVFFLFYSRDWGISYWFSTAYLVPLLITVVGGLNLAAIIRDRLKAEEVL